MAFSKLCILAMCRTTSTSLISFSDFFFPKSTSPSHPLSRLKFDAFDLSGLKTVCCPAQKLIFLISSSTSLLVCMATRKHSGQASGGALCNTSQILTTGLSHTSHRDRAPLRLSARCGYTWQDLDLGSATVTKGVVAGPCQQAVQDRRTVCLSCPVLPSQMPYARASSRHCKHESMGTEEVASPSSSTEREERGCFSRRNGSPWRAPSSETPSTHQSKTWISLCYTCLQPYVCPL